MPDTFHTRVPSPRRRHRRRQRRFLLVLLLFACAALLYSIGQAVFPLLFPLTESPLRAFIPRPAAVSAGVPAISVPDGLYSRCAVLADLESGEILMDGSGEERAYPASLTKIMTAAVALESFPDLDATVTLTEADFAGLYEENASLAGFQPNQEVVIRDLLYGLMLPSGAEAAAALANNAAGSQQAFVDRMNQKAQALGMEGTHFTNATGLHDPDHYTTARDMILLLRDALQSPGFREIFTAQRHSTRETATHPGITFYSTLSQVLDSPDFPGGQLLGGKTGYTQEAGLCLASLAQKNGKEYLLVTMGAPGDHTTEPFHILDAMRIYGEALP